MTATGSHAGRLLRMLGTAAPVLLATLACDAPPPASQRTPTAQAQPTVHTRTIPFPSDFLAIDSSTLAAIRDFAERLDGQLAACALRSHDVDGFSAEGGSANFYRCANGNAEATQELFGETGRYREEFYWRADTLVLVHKVSERYNHSISGPDDLAVTDSTVRWYYLAASSVRAWRQTPRQLHSLTPAERSALADSLQRSADIARRRAQGDSSAFLP